MTDQLDLEMYDYRCANCYCYHDDPADECIDPTLGIKHGQHAWEPVCNQCGGKIGDDGMCKECR